VAAGARDVTGRRDFEGDPGMVVVWKVRGRSMKWGGGEREREREGDGAKKV
jgi:hypothetical protein